MFFLLSVLALSGLVMRTDPPLNYHGSSVYEGSSKQFATARIQLELSSPSPRHYTDEPLILDTTIRNTGDAAVRIPISVVPAGNAHIQVFDSSEKLVEYPDYYKIVEYLQRDRRSVDLEPSEYWGTRSISACHVVLHSPGEYYLVALIYLEVPGHLGRRMWIGSLRSAPLKVTVLPRVSDRK